MQTKKIVYLASDCESSRWVFNSLKKEFFFSGIITELPVSKKTLFKNRLKKIGIIKVTGQVLFSLLMVPILRFKAKKRKQDLLNQYHLDNSDFPTGTIHVISVNDDSCLKALQELQPDIVLVNGTRIISKNILTCSKAVFINMHVGITPYYRGSHGGYWALYNKDVANFGTTIHLVDMGVDTGGVISQAFITPDKKDNFTTYPILQVAIGIEALKKVLPDIVSGKFEVKKHMEKGRMYYQPTIWQYLLS